MEQSSRRTNTADFGMTHPSKGLNNELQGNGRATVDASTPEQPSQRARTAPSIIAQLSSTLNAPEKGKGRYVHLPSVQITPTEYYGSSLVHNEGYNRQYSTPKAEEISEPSYNQSNETNNEPTHVIPTGRIVVPSQNVSDQPNDAEASTSNTASASPSSDIAPFHMFPYKRTPDKDTYRMHLKANRDLIFKDIKVKEKRLREDMIGGWDSWAEKMEVKTRGKRNKKLFDTIEEEIKALGEHLMFIEPLHIMAKGSKASLGRWQKIIGDRDSDSC